MSNDVPTPRNYVKLYTDGACSGNPGPGGWAFVLIHPATGKQLSDSGAEAETTNNRMELTSVIKGLEALKRPCVVEIVTDSDYVRKGILEWMAGWKARGWQRKDGGKLKPVLNADLWKRIDELADRHQLRVTHVAGHSGHPENELCDRMAVAAYRKLIAG
ncbi:RNase HI [Isosphaera pallida ATCC 43644]|jgi:ribonuclease HI|uniref:Ribonuclease H n=1 Tax=Isosphaera pallida (strain ATCC 43644 / DSM 9630 / IS1B) TaxID=575540 RepID=E8QXP7_ISOPI|nr:ribonuclease HI [Isosphaera pallida]ADV64084.1 RNase HI [Isosphaera pallida ATCC 43644]